MKFQIKQLQLNQIKPNKAQVRKIKFQEEIDRIANSIKQEGLINLIEVEPNGSYYHIITGEMRYWASKKAGLEKVWCKVFKKPLTNLERKTRQLHENLIRGDLLEIDLGKALLEIKDSSSVTEEALAKQFQLSLTWTNTLLKLAKEKDKRIKRMAKRKDFSVARLDEIRKSKLTEKQQDRFIDFLEKQPKINLHGFRRIIQASIQAPHLTDKFLKQDYKGLKKFQIYRKVREIYPEFVEMIEDGDKRILYLSERMSEILANLNYYPLASYSDRNAAFLVTQIKLFADNVGRFVANTPVKIPKRLTTRK